VFCIRSSSTSKILVPAILLFSAGHGGAFTQRTILEQRHTEIPE
jgi:hypothetical protein